MADNHHHPGEANFQGERNKNHGGGALWWGFILIFSGVIILLQRAGLFVEVFNWWALFIFIPVIGSLAGAAAAFRHSGRFNRAVRSGLGGALVVGTVAVLLLFGMDWSVWWPLMIIMPGFSMFLSGFPDRGENIHARTWSGLSIWVGLGAMLLGGGFLAQSYFGVNPQEFTGRFTWWSMPILLVGVGGLINSILISITSGSFTWSARGSLLIGLATLAVGAVAALGYSWNLVGPLVLIVFGLGFLVTGLVK